MTEKKEENENAAACICIQVCDYACVSAQKRNDAITTTSKEQNHAYIKNETDLK